MVKPYLNQVGGKVDDDVALFNGGLNTYVDKAFLESNQMPYVMNMTMETPPAIETRHSRTSIVTYMENEEWDEYLGNIIDVYAYDENQIFLISDVLEEDLHGDYQPVRRLVEVYFPYSNGYQNRYKVRIFTDYVIPEDNYYFTVAKRDVDQFIYLTGETFKIRITIETDPEQTSIQKVEDGYYGMCCCHKGRLFLGSPDTNKIVFSALYDFDNFDKVINYMYIGTVPQDWTGADTSYIYLVDNDELSYTQYQYNEGTWYPLVDTLPKADVFIDQSTGLSIPDYSQIAGEFKVTNSIGKLVSIKSFDDKLMIFCDHSMHCVYGSTPDMSLSEHFQLVDLNNNLGAISDRCITIGGGRLFWLGDNMEVYEYTGSAINIISRPGTTRNSTLSVGGVSSLIYDVGAGYVDTLNSHAKFEATSEKLYINIWNRRKGFDAAEKLLLVFDIYNRVWWCEDGAFNTIGNYSDHVNKILLATAEGDLLINNNAVSGYDYLFNFNKGIPESVPIKYEFHTRMYGADGADMRKTLNDVWFQARAEAEVFVNDTWTSYDAWAETAYGLNDNFIKIGTLKNEAQSLAEKTKYRTYQPYTYEQQPCYVPKMYGQRLNTFQITVRGEGISRFYLMKREWRAE